MIFKLLYFCTTNFDEAFCCKTNPDLLVDFERVAEIHSIAETKMTSRGQYLSLEQYYKAMEADLNCTSAG